MPFHPTRPSLLKLYALPLSRPSASSAPLFYLHPKKQQAPTHGPNGEPVKLPLVSRATNKAADTWNGFGKKESGWQKKVFDVGSRLTDKIEYEEWALKAVDPALSPKPWEALTSDAAAKEGESASAPAAPKKEIVEILYPKSILDSEALLSTLRKQVAHREPHHRALMRRCIVLSPLTWPFAIIPVVPNLPLFYVLWRAWSHYKAWKASEYLRSVINSPGQLTITPSAELDNIFSGLSRDSTGLLLTEERAKEVVREMGLEQEEAQELLRAVAQAGQRLDQGRKESEKEQAKESKEEVEKKTEQ